MIQFLAQGLTLLYSRLAEFFFTLVKIRLSHAVSAHNFSYILQDSSKIESCNTTSSDNAYVQDSTSFLMDTDMLWWLSSKI